MRVFRSHLQNAFESLSANRMRTFLTILGVLIGIASITIIMSLSGGITDLTSGQITDQGGAITVVRPQEVGVNNRNIISSLATSRSFARSSITEQDYTSILEIENIDAVAPLASFVSEMRAGTDKITSNIEEMDIPIYMMKLEHSDILGMFYEIIEYHLLSAGFSSFGKTKYFDKDSKRLKNGCFVYDAIKITISFADGNVVMNLSELP